MTAERDGAKRSRGRRVTQREIADIVGVSSATVSYAFNGTPGVSEDVRQRILTVAKDLGFRPNRTAQGLRRGRMNMIGLLLADIANPFYPELSSGVINAASAHGSQVFLAQVGLGGMLQAEAARNLVDRGCDGLVFTSVVDGDTELLRELQAADTPFVYANRRVDAIPADWVHVDDFAASREAAEWVVRSGRLQVAVIGGPSESSVSHDRARGALAALGAAGLSPVDERLIDGELSRDSGRERCAALLDSGAAVDAIVCGNDMIALGVMDVCHARGVLIPEDVAIVGFDDMSFASAGPLQLSTVTVPRQLMGERAVAMLFDRIDGYDGPPREECLPHQLRIRATTGPRTAGPTDQRGTA
ncbi:LacI family DNA-binding transcriptional regulator [Jiangella asiatica]|uniref:LacI family transcriptional regulator n=1 Tax=Jiangella asiatica TaxID=2530372 RepID=A0A4V2Z2L5_9ACTN|nr:LacI family DNA-binding transcriptional regulator [Jiangella asiatica]TDE09298.1 LacI family transcriptional regulator [Jiangella asiatica]